MAAAKLKNKKKAGDGSALKSVLDTKGEKFAYEVLDEEKIPGSRVRFKLKLGEDALKGRLEATYKEFNRYVNVPGFRPGHVPKALIQKRFEPAVREEMVKRIIGRLTELYTEEKGIEPISQPYLLDWKSNAQDGTTVELALEVHPEVPLTEDKLNDINVEVHKIRIDDSFVAAELESLQARNATFEPTEEGYRPKDGMLLNCTVTDVHGNKVWDRSATDYYTTNLEEEMPEQVAAALVGAKKGDTVNLDVAEEADDAPSGTLETVHYAVEVLEVKARNLPTLDDEFAKDVDEKFETLEDLKSDILAKGAAAETERERNEALERIYDVLRDRVDFDLPRALVDQQSQNSLYEMEQRLNKMGVSLRNMDKTIVQNYVSGVRVQSRLSVKNSLLLKEWSKQLNLTPSEADIAAELEKLAASSGRKPLAVRAQIEARKEWDAFVANITLRKANDELVRRAAVSYKEVSLEEFNAMARQRQEEQAARLRGEEVRAQAQDAAEAKSLNVSVEELEEKLDSSEVPNQG